MYPELKSEMAKKGWTQKALAEATGLTQCAVSHILNGKRDPKISFCIAAKRAIGSVLPLEILFKWVEG